MKNLDIRNACLFLIGLGVVFRVQAVGELLASDFLILGVAPIAFFRIQSLVKGPSRWLLILGVSYFIGLLLADFVRESAFNDWTRGQSKVGIMIIAIAVITYLSGLQLQRLNWFFSGYGLGQLLGHLLMPGSFANMWKFGWGPTLTLLLALACGYTALNTRLQAAAFGGFGVFHLLMNSRSLAGTTLFTALATLLSTFRSSTRRNFSLWTLAPLGLVGFAVFSLYTYGSPRGWFGEESQKKYSEQATDGKFSVLSGRGELVAAWTAIKDSPLIGYGSWPRSEKYVRLFMDVQGIDPGKAYGKFLLERKLIPGHSHFLGGWMEAGLTGGIFWLYSLVMAIKTVTELAKINSGERYKLVYIYLLVLFMWDICFSPFGSSRRILNAALLVLCVAIKVESDLDRRFTNSSAPI